MLIGFEDSLGAKVGELRIGLVGGCTGRGGGMSRESYLFLRSWISSAISFSTSSSFSLS